MPALVVLTLAAGCGGAPSDIRQRIARFQAHANAGRLPELPVEYERSQALFQQYLSVRAKLGRMLETTEASARDIKWIQYGGPGKRGRTLVVYYNTRFEKGHAVEHFVFDVETAERRLSLYQFSAGKRMWCPTIPIFKNECSLEDAR
jgi:hypothetical protein